MGYDMYHWAGPTPEEEAATAAARAAFDQAVATRDTLGREAGSILWDEEYVATVMRPGWVRVDRADGDILVGTPEWVAAQTAVSDAFAAMNDAQASAFRLNIHGMRLARQAMAEVGMIHCQFEDQAPPWVDHPCQNDVDPCSMCDLQMNDRDTYYRTAQPRLAWAPEVPGIPVWKFGSNDGWLVGPVECLGALDAWEKAPDALKRVILDRLPWWPEWLAYLAAAAQRGGFCVH